VGSAARGLPDISAIGAALIVWVALELLVYQARYQWNDIRGFEADQQHPGGDRGRLPGPRERRNSRFAWSGVTAAAKVVGAIGLCWALDATVGLSMLLLTAGVFGLAVVYESLRSTSTGRTDQAPAPITRGIVAIWVVIGAGYSPRTSLPRRGSWSRPC
jgi:4-hydroxybenzoate polyprenyltransferase